MAYNVFKYELKHGMFKLLIIGGLLDFIGLNLP